MCNRVNHSGNIDAHTEEIIIQYGWSDNVFTKAVSYIISVLGSAYGCLIPGDIRTLSYKDISNIILHHRILLYYSTTVPTLVSDWMKFRDDYFDDEDDLIQAMAEIQMRKAKLKVIDKE